MLRHPEFYGNWNDRTATEDGGGSREFEEFLLLRQQNAIRAEDREVDGYPDTGLGSHLLPNEVVLSKMIKVNESNENRWLCRI